MGNSIIESGGSDGAERPTKAVGNTYSRTRRGFCPALTDIGLHWTVAIVSRERRTIKEDGSTVERTNEAEGAHRRWNVYVTSSTILCKLRALVLSPRRPDRLGDLGDKSGKELCRGIS